MEREYQSPGAVWYGMRMQTAVIIGVIVVALAALLLLLLRGIDMAELRAYPQGIVSVEGLAIITGLGFVLGLGYGLLIGSKAGSPPLLWIGRGLIDGLVMACATVFYVRILHRRQRNARRLAEGSAAAEVDGAGEGGRHPDG